MRYIISGDFFNSLIFQISQLPQGKAFVTSDGARLKRADK